MVDYIFYCHSGSESKKCEVFVFATGASWEAWKKSYRFGTLVFVPHDEIRSIIDGLRMEYDPVSARTSMAHLTLTQPFSSEPSRENIGFIEKICDAFLQFEIALGPVTTSPNKKLIWLDVNPIPRVLVI